MSNDQHVLLESLRAHEAQNAKISPGSTQISTTKAAFFKGRQKSMRKRLILSCISVCALVFKNQD